MILLKDFVAEKLRSPHLARSLHQAEMVVQVVQVEAGVHLVLVAHLEVEVVEAVRRLAFQLVPLEVREVSEADPFGRSALMQLTSTQQQNL